jgi:Methyltransferase domain
MNNFDQALQDLDLGLFEKIASQSTEADKQSFLAVQNAVRELHPDYSYLEIGSYLGGSIQPHLLDPKCRRIYSVDKRPAIQPDARGIDYVYQNNSTARMLEMLQTVSPDLAKIVTIDGDSRELDPSRVEDKVQLSFIDGEHTDAAVMADFKFSLKTLDTAGAIVFHDAQITYNGIADCVRYLEESSHDFHAYALPSIVFVIEIGEFPLHKHPKIMQRLIDNHQSYLFSLQNNDEFRRFANKFPFRLLRNMYARVRKGNVSR